MKQLFDFLREKEIDYSSYSDAIYICWDLEKNQEFFIFPYGCIAFWGFDESKEMELIEYFSEFLVKPLKNPVSDFCKYIKDSEKTEIDEELDTIHIEDNNDILIKLSFSYALTQSIKLNFFESVIDETIESTKFLPTELSSFGKTKLSSRELSRKVGELFAIRNSINLHTDILDLPEFFWRKPKYEPLYHDATSFMDLTQRFNVLNRRLDVIKELYEILSNELKYAHTSKLEWTVIILITIEVVFHITEVLFFKN